MSLNRAKITDWRNNDLEVRGFRFSLPDDILLDILCDRLHLDLDKFALGGIEKNFMLDDHVLCLYTTDERFPTVQEGCFADFIPAYIRRTAEGKLVEVTWASHDFTPFINSLKSGESISFSDSYSSIQLSNELGRQGLKFICNYDGSVYTYSLRE